jgi:hypothetical protein
MCLMTLFNWLVIRTMNDAAMEDAIFLVLHLHLSKTSDLI